MTTNSEIQSHAEQPQQPEHPPRGALWAWGLFVVNPALSAGLAPATRLQAWIAILAYGWLRRGADIVRVFSDWLVTRDFNGMLLLAQVVGFGVLPPLVALSLAERVLGDDGRARHAIGHMLIVSIVAWGFASAGLSSVGTGFAIDLAAIVGAGVGAWVASRAPTSAATGGSAPPVPRVWRISAIALVVVGLLGSVSLGALNLREMIASGRVGALQGPGASLPVVQLETVGGDVVILGAGDTTEQPMMLVFWATWCGSCTWQIDELVSLHGRAALDGVRVIAVNVDRGSRQDELVAAYLREHPIPFEVAYDLGQPSGALGVSMLPHIVISDRHGRIEAVHVGRMSGRRLESSLANARGR